jgi:hypothetical protein
MTKKSISRLLQASLMCCLAVLFTACDDIFAGEDNPIPAYLSMSDKPVTLKVGDTYRRKAISVTSAVVEYSSSKTDVATVDNEGLVTAKAEGTTTITATATGYSSQNGKKIYQPASVSYVVTVVPATVAVTGLTLNKANLRFGMNAPTAQALIADVLPADATDKTVTWTSSDPTVATVDASGNVTPVAKGTVTITAKAGDQTATSSVYVYDKIVDINVGAASVTAGESWLINGDGTAVANGITIGDGATVTLNGINISKQIECSGTATIILADGSTNTVTETSVTKAGIQIGGTGKTLTINGETAGTGTLTAQGGYCAAGIGTSMDGTGGNIVINGGTVTATGGANAAGIGGGYAYYATNECGAITINGGTVTAQGGSNGAGIGTGNADSSTSTNKCGAITINGGTVIATGGKYGAGIGTGNADYAASTNECGAITIGTGVTSVTATKGTDSPNSIGKGYNHSSSTQTCGTITIGGDATTYAAGVTVSPFTYPAP